MTNPHLKFHHFGLAVRGPDQARRFLTSLGYLLGEAVFDPKQQVNLQLCVHPVQPAVEIIWPGQSSGPIDQIIQRHPAGIVYHLCYESRDLDAALAAFDEAGLGATCISPAKPALLFGGRAVSFYNVIGIGLIEILE